MNNEHTANVRIGNVIVHRSRIAGTRSLVVYSAWEASSYFGPHSTLFTIDGQTCGSITTRRLTKELDALPAYSQERMNAVDAFHKANEAEAYAAILAAFPEASEGVRARGEIEVGSW